VGAFRRLFVAPVACLIAAAAPWTGAAAALDLAVLWDFDAPAESERRFRQVLKDARGDDALVLKTQIARTYGLRKDFDKAREILKEIEPAMASAGPEVRARYWLELGRTYASGRHAPESITEADRARARNANDRALEISRAARLDGLAIDALHMYAFIDPAPADQLAWSRRALELVESSSQAEAKRWEASIRNNVGESLFDLGRHEEALVEFERALALREQGTNPKATRHARTQVERTRKALGR
jgi:tetratricopeptide (TPR) repeat protein